MFEEDLHAKRVLSLAHATLGVVHAASLSVHAIGQALAWARGGVQKHGIKQVDRLLSNEAVDVWKLAASWVPYVLAERTEALVVLCGPRRCPRVKQLLSASIRPPSVRLRGDMLTRCRTHIRKLFQPQQKTIAETSLLDVRRPLMMMRRKRQIQLELTFRFGND
ncbi:MULTISPECIES: hypothetical protein [Corallococcus]|uniref:hypothetical protein n=1 Tax=Corallococcus TaxID=83461 RepID=UPI001F38E151|nr:MULTISPECIES: hypothetical protein [Corallococcus]